MESIKIKTLKEIKEYDTIELNVDPNIIQYPPKEFKSESVFNVAVIKYPLTVEGVVVKMFALVNSEENYIEVYSYYTDSYLFRFLFKADVSGASWEEIKYYYQDNEMPRNFMKITLMQVFNLMTYISYTVQNREIVLKTEKTSKKTGEKTTSSKNTNNKKTISVLNKDKVIYTIKTSDNNFIKRRYQRHTESWSVIGHERTYKSGKKVWVQPCTKGKGKKQPKKYIVE